MAPAGDDDDGLPAIAFHVGHQSFAYRLLELYRDPLTRRAAFGGLEAGAVEEVGPHSERLGPGLALFTRVRGAGAADLRPWMEQSMLRWAVVRVYWLDRVSTSRETLLAELLAAGPPPGGALRLQAAPRELEAWLAAALPEETWALHPVRFAHVLCAVAEHGGGGGRVRWSVRPAAELFRNHSAGPTRVPGQLCKAAGKLLEALAFAGVGDLDLGSGRPPAGVALDVGAAPGGWTALLAARYATVVAVDPAALDPAVASHPRVVHVRAKAEAAAAAVAAAAAGRPIDLLACDVNQMPHVACAIVRAALPALRPGGLLVMTAKFPGSGRERSVGVLVEMLGGEAAFARRSLVWLLANSICERTLVAVRAG